MNYCDHAGDFGLFLYMRHPDVLMRAIRVSEGVPSYGVIWLAKKYGGHARVPVAEGRRAAARILHATHKRWRESGSCVPFLRYLGSVYAPVGADNDPMGLNQNWIENVALNSAMQLAEIASRGN